MGQIPAAGEWTNHFHSETFSVIWLFTHASVWLIGANLAHSCTITFLQNCLLSLHLLWFRSYWLMWLLVTVQKYRFFSYSALEGIYQSSEKILSCTLSLILVGFFFYPQQSSTSFPCQFLFIYCFYCMNVTSSRAILNSMGFLPCLFSQYQWWYWRGWVGVT